jgi:hypothetical protein
LATFSEVHSYAFPAGILLQFTSMVCQGLTLHFPKLKLAFLESAPLGCLITSIDWTSTGRNAVNTKCRCSKKPSDVVRQSKMYFSVEPANRSLRHH